jgi:hypothetical protein
MICLDPVVGIPVRTMPRRRQQLVQHHQRGRRQVGHNLARAGSWSCRWPAKEPPCRDAVPPWRDEHVDDLPRLIDRPVEVAPATGDLHIGLVHGPAISDPMAPGSGGLNEQRREPLDPPVDGDVVDLDAAFGEQLFDVAVGEAKAQVPADRQHDHIRREAETGEGRLWDGIGADAVSSHDTSLAARVCSQQMQQRPPPSSPASRSWSSRQPRRHRRQRARTRQTESSVACSTSCQSCRAPGWNTYSSGAW